MNKNHVLTMSFTCYIDLFCVFYFCFFFVCRVQEIFIDTEASGYFAVAVMDKRPVCEIRLKTRFYREFYTNA